MFQIDLSNISIPPINLKICVGVIDVQLVHLIVQSYYLLTILILS